jgi:transposase
MTAERPEDVPSLADEWRSVREGESTRDRVSLVALQFAEPTRVRAVAERADVSKETARDYLRWFAEIGLVDQVSASPETFEGNEDYFEWRRLQRLRSASDEERLARLESLTRSERDYRERFGVDDPADVDALEHGDYDDLDAVWLALREWRTVRRRIRDLERARQSRDDGDRVPA